MTIAVTNPLAAELCVSLRASQHATPIVSNPAPPTRATTHAAASCSGVPSNSFAADDGRLNKAKPAPASITAVVVQRAFTTV